MVISGKAQTKTDELAEKCYNMMKSMYKTEYSEFLNMFYGISVSQIKSKESDYKNIIPEPFFNINVPISEKKTLIDCFDLYTEGEILDGDNCVLNEKTGKKEAACKNLMFWSLPTILVIDIKRFNASNRKNQILIDFPLNNLDLSKYVIGYNKESYVYDLYGVCNHSGNVLGGHYTSYVKNANGKWFHFNDTSVSEVGVIESIISVKAYCLFYRKKS